METENVIGFFMNSLAIRCDLSPEKGGEENNNNNNNKENSPAQISNDKQQLFTKFLTVLQRTNSTCVEAFEHQGIFIRYI